MSTRCHIIVEDEEWGISTILYRHSDGYPDGKFGVVTELAEFLKRFMKVRGWDPCYLPAQLLHFMIARNDEHMLEVCYKPALERNPGDSHYKDKVDNGGNDLLGYGISPDIHGDIEYAYVITKQGVHVYDTPCMENCEDRSTWKRLTTPKQAKAIMEGKVPRKWKERN